jgi:uncharacterized membrane protein
MQFIYFLGRFHVVLVHLPIGFVLAVVFIEFVARREKYRQLNSAAPFLWGVAAISAVITATLGYMHYAEGGFTGWPVHYHRVLGTLLAIAALVAWALRVKNATLYRKLQVPIWLLVLVLVAAAGHTGGSVTHGPTFLLELAPAPIRTLAGVTPKRPKVNDWTSADPYEDVVQPVFKNRCSGCHGDDTQKNNLDLVNYTAAMKGGKIGMDIVPGDPQHSELYRRITLSSDDKDFMPAEGKPPLTDAEVKIIKWWIQVGAPTHTTMAKLSVSPEVQSLLAARIGASAAAPSAPAAGTPTTTAGPAQLADPKLVDAIAAAGFDVRQISMDNAHLVVSVNGGGKPVAAASLQVLVTAHDQIDEVDLQRSEVTDEELKIVGQLSNLSRLRLDGNKISDKGLRELSGLQKLEILNLYGNEGVTDSGLVVLAQMPALQRVYLWNTRVTAKGARAMEKKHPQMVVDVGADAGSVGGA